MSKVTVVAMGGEPACGKTTIFKRLRAALPGTNQLLKYGLVRGLVNADRSVIIIGVYDGSTFEGSDKLAMSVQPEFIKMVEQMRGWKHDSVIYLEGDRLFTASMFKAVGTVTGLVVEATDATKAARHLKRADNQSDTFLKAKRTKIANMVQEFPSIVRMPNDTDEQQEAILQWLLSHVPKP